ncbi:hypothetical protein MNBD_GAMMA07-1079, partial [hydrothermal vent metagenome]
MALNFSLGTSPLGTDRRFLALCPLKPIPPRADRALNRLCKTLDGINAEVRAI